MADTDKVRTKVTVTIPDDLLTEGKILAVKRKTSFSAIAEIALQYYIESVDDHQVPTRPKASTSENTELNEDKSVL